MPAYNYQRRFAEDVRLGRKRQTIRRKRKRPTVVGDTLYQYTGQRTRGCELLGVFRCSAVRGVDIHHTHVMVEGETVKGRELWALAEADGFGTPREFLGFFDNLYRLPCVGELEMIEWEVG